MHQRAMDMEIEGHEFWSHDGKLIWFDLQTPRSQDFWLANVDVKTGKETHYHLARDWWGVHYSVAWDGKMCIRDRHRIARAAGKTARAFARPVRARTSRGTTRERR